MDKRKRAQRREQEDATLMKALVWVAGAVVLEALLLLLDRFYVNYTVSQIELAAGIDKALPILSVLFALCCAASVIWLLRKPEPTVQTRFPVWLPVVCIASSAALAVCCAVAYLGKRSGIQFLHVMVLVAAVLVLIFYFCQKEFFAITLLNTGGLVGLWLIQHMEGYERLVYCSLAGLGAVLIAAAAAARFLQRSDGIAPIGSRSIRIFQKGVNYPLFYVTCGLIAIVIVCALAMGASMLLYAVLFAWLLIMAVYYTIRLI